MKKTSIFSNGVLWFGAAVSIAEIATGTLFAPLGLINGSIAIVTGHVIGCFLLYLAGLIGANTQKSAMDTVKISFGYSGTTLFSTLNILQLIGWTAVMIIGGATSAHTIFPFIPTELWSLIIGLLILLWSFFGIKNFHKINTLAICGLLILSIILSSIIFGNTNTATFGEGQLHFGLALELSIAMPLSWLPLISDYTSVATQRKSATFVSAISYFFASCWMYLIGLGAALFANTNSIPLIMKSAGLGVFGLLIIIFSTVTTTFLDVYSAGISFKSIFKKNSEKHFTIAACIIGIILAICTPVTEFENFLYLISSVFAPMIAILFTDYFILKKNSTFKKYNFANLLIWLSGFILYRIALTYHWNTPLGITLPIMSIISVICILIYFARRKKYVS